MMNTARQPTFSSTTGPTVRGRPVTTTLEESEFKFVEGFAKLEGLSLSQGLATIVREHLKVVEIRYAEHQLQEAKKKAQEARNKLSNRRSTR